MVMTRKGDDCTTFSMLSKSRKPKSHWEIEIYGLIDEMLAWLGLTHASIDGPIRDEISKVVKQVHTLMGNGLELNDGFVKELEELIEGVEVDGFIFESMNSLTCAHLNMARVLCRKIERLLCKHDLCVSKYFNRLADVIFVWMWKLSKEFFKDCGG